MSRKKNIRVVAVKTLSEKVAEQELAAEKYKKFFSPGSAVTLLGDRTKRSVDEFAACVRNNLGVVNFKLQCQVERWSLWGVFSKRVQVDLYAGTFTEFGNTPYSGNKTAKTNLRVTDGFCPVVVVFDTNDKVWPGTEAEHAPLKKSNCAINFTFECGVITDIQLITLEK